MKTSLDIGLDLVSPPVYDTDDGNPFISDTKDRDFSFVISKI